MAIAKKIPFHAITSEELFRTMKALSRSNAMTLQDPGYDEAIYQIALSFGLGPWFEPVTCGPTSQTIRLTVDPDADMSNWILAEPKP